MEAAKLKTYLECPVCLLLPRSRIFSCVNSHQICESCHSKLVGAKQCPQGGCGFDQPPRRARVFEAMIENSNLDLNCNRPGCDVELKKGCIEAHELKCIYRTVPCPVVDCQKEILFKNLDLHKSNHFMFPAFMPDVAYFFSEECLNDNNYAGFISYTCKIDEVEFYPVFVKKNGLWYFWVSIKEDWEAASTWSFTAKVKNDGNKIAMEFSGMVHPIDVTVDEVIESGHYLLLSRRNVDKLIVPCGQLIGFVGRIQINLKLVRE